MVVVDFFVDKDFEECCVKVLVFDWMILDFVVDGEDGVVLVGQVVDVQQVVFFYLVYFGDGSVELFDVVGYGGFFGFGVVVVYVFVDGFDEFLC